MIRRDTRIRSIVNTLFGTAAATSAVGSEAWLARSVFVGEGERKVRARVRVGGVRTLHGRVQRPMRAAGA